VRKSAALLLALAVTGCKRQEPFEILQAPPSPTLQKYWELPEFALTERSGQPFRRADLLGKVWIADFFYTTCPGPCPMMSSRLSALQEKLTAKPDACLVSISLDPAKDTPEVLQQYATKFHAEKNWLFLTGDKTTIYALAHDGFKLAIAEERNSPEPITHSTKLVLVDRAGWVRGFYEGVGEDQTARLLADIDHLLAEKP
jgi:protein SCO1/2